MKQRRRAVGLALGLILTVAAPSLTHAQTPTQAQTPVQAQPASDPIANVVAKVSSAVVRVITVRPPSTDDSKENPQVAGASASTAAATDETTTAIGSGFIIDPSGYIATNKHVVDGGASVFVMTADGVRYQASVVGMPGKADMALLRIYAGHPLPFGTVRRQ